MKRIFPTSAIVIVLTVILLTTITCNKKLLNLPPPTASELTYFTTQSAFKEAILGVYATLTDYYSSSNESVGGTWEGEVTWLPGDDLTNGGSQVFEDFNGINPSVGQIGEDFRKCAYLLLGRANIVPQQDQVSKPNDISHSRRGMQNYITGEALFLRAFGHYQLWNIFGTAPLDTLVVTTTGQLNAPGSTGTQLLDQAISWI